MSKSCVDALKMGALCECTCTLVLIKADQAMPESCCTEQTKRLDSADGGNGNQNVRFKKYVIINAGGCVAVPSVMFVKCLLTHFIFVPDDLGYCEERDRGILMGMQK